MKVPGPVDAPLILGSPGLNDAVMHMLQACIPDRRMLPAGFRSLNVTGQEVRGAVQVIGALGFLAVFAAGIGLRSAEITTVEESPHPDAADNPSVQAHPPAETLVAPNVVTARELEELRELIRQHTPAARPGEGRT